MESVGFKEWSVVSEALGCGLQSILLRKGGIAEGGAGFSYRHREFFLFPTHFHEQLEKVRRIDIPIPEPEESKIGLKYWARIEDTRVLISWPMAAALESLHVLRREVVQERFEDDRTPGIHIAFVRVFRVEPIWTIPCEKRYRGCRSWVNLPERPAGLRFGPVLSDDQHERKRCAFSAAICGGS